MSRHVICYECYRERFDANRFDANPTIVAPYGEMLVCEWCAGETAAGLTTNDEPPACRVCGCTVLKACVTKAGACFWIEADLCSACVAKTESKQKVAKEAKR